MQDFSQHLLRKNHRSTRPDRILFFDTEADREIIGNIEKHTMKMAWTCYSTRPNARLPRKEVWKFWDGQYKMWQYIESLAVKKTVVYIIAHNIFYDLQSSGFFRYFTRWGYVLDFIYDKGLTYILNIRKGNLSFRLISSTNYFDVSLASLGDMIGLKKLDVDFNNAGWNEMKAYCHRDVEILRAVMLQYIDFLTEHDLGKFSLTRAAQSMAAYRHRFMDHKISIHSDETVTELETKAYSGGRCECFCIGVQSDGPFISLDINSMYPYVMRTFQYPCRLINFRRDVKLSLAKEIIRKFGCISEVKLSTDEPVYAVREKNKLIFPVGNFTAFLCTGGLREALKRGHVKEIINMAVYETAPLFVRYVDYFYSLRAEYKKRKEPIYNRMLKLFLNSLYGKWAQWQPETTETEDVTFEGYWRMATLDLLTGETDMEYKLLNKVIRQTGKSVGKNSFVAIAAHVTEYARLLLWSIIEDIGIDRVLYCDTDSVKIRACDFDRVKWRVNELDMGALKIDDEFTYFDIRGAKNYVTEKARHIKGIPLKAVEIAPFRFRFASFAGQTRHLNHKNDVYQEVKYTTRYSPRLYTKGDINDNGSISPFRF